MEIYSKTTRFALACNASDKIIGIDILAVLFSMTSSSSSSSASRAHSVPMRSVEILQTE